jgi:hypothetical protein
MPDDPKTPATPGAAPKKAKELDRHPVEAEKPDSRGARVCKESDRATPGLKRFRVRAPDERPLGLYILAPEAAAAKVCYLAAEKFPTEPTKVTIDELVD